MDTVLAGPDGKPAIDAATGMPLTMEAMMARRGILAVNGASSPFNQQQQAQTVQPQAIVASSPEPTSVAEAIKMMRQGNPGGAMNVTGVTPSVDPLNPSVNTTLPGPTAGGDASDLLPWLIGGGAGIGTYAAAKALSNRRKKPTSKIDDASFGANTGSAPKPGQLPGEGGKPPKALNGPRDQKRLTGPKTSSNVIPIKGVDEIPYGEFEEVKFLNSVRKALTDPKTDSNVVPIKNIDEIPYGEFEEVKFLDSVRKALTDRKTQKALTRIVR